MVVAVSFSQPVVAIELIDRDLFILHLSFPPPNIELKILEWAKSNSEIASIQICGELPNHLEVEINVRHVFATWGAIEEVKNLLILNNVSIVQ